ncbi:hypothetical protein MIMGU_mgv1a017176mg [Erythranthe guttata]|uniref:Uncharacterized protein n=1 Tax=Erythranthe guttata TaxID=4155 RepID=A0A022QL12_ERYGU|nr:hypothetical protein MIMGU_mgv1a017176mg [Erythranthe guttata]
MLRAAPDGEISEFCPDGIGDGLPVVLSMVGDAGDGEKSEFWPDGTGDGLPMVLTMLGDKSSISLSRSGSGDGVRSELTGAGLGLSFTAST